MGTSRGRPRWWRATTVALLALALMAALTPVNAGAARRAPKRAVAERLATQLLKKQLGDNKRQLVEGRISKGVQRGDGSWAFLYDDLARDGDVCTATIVVKFNSVTSTTVTAAFVGSHCQNPGDEMLAFRTASRAFARAQLRAAPAVRRSVRRFTTTLKTCERIKDVPADRKEQVKQLLSADAARAIFGPLDATVDSFASSLQAVGAHDARLTSGAAAWRDYLDAARALPALDPDACSLLSDWAAKGWTAEAAPVDFTALDTLTKRIETDGKQIARTGRYMVKHGLDRLTAATFAGEDLPVLTPSFTAGGAGAG